MMMNPSGMFIWSMRVVLIYSFEQRAIFDEKFFFKRQVRRHLANGIKTRDNLSAYAVDTGR